MKFNLKVQIYVLKDLLSPFILSLFVFLFTILMVQAFRFTDIMLMSNGDVLIILNLLKNLIVSTFPIIFPLSLLAALLLGYGRLSQDSELIAFSSLGYGTFQIVFPAFLLGSFVFYLSLVSVTEVGPLGTKASKNLAKKMQTETLKTTLRPGVFVNVNDVTFYIKSLTSDKDRKFENIFILDGRKDKAALILSQKGHLVDAKNQAATYLKLNDGEIHFQPQPHSHATVTYDQYDLSFVNKGDGARDRESVKTLTNTEVRKEYARLKDYGEGLRQKEKLGKEEKKDLDYIFDLKVENTKRWQMAFSCIVFVIMGLSFGFHTFNRVSRSESIGVCLGLSLMYWIIYFVFESLAYRLSQPFMFYFPNMIFLSIALLYLAYRNSWFKKIRL